jgi:hypothetical protein
MRRLLYLIKRVYRSLFVSSQMHAIGDSHVDVFWDMEFSPLYFWWAKIKIKVVHGATATGLENPNSKTKAKENFKEYIQNEVRKNDIVVFQLGEVDCGFAIWYRSKKHNLSVEDQVNMALNNYMALVQLAEDKEAKVFVCSTVLPTIQDNQNMGEVANLRKEIDVSLKERTELTLNFNEKIALLLKNKSTTFLNFDDLLLDKKTKLVKTIFLNKDPNNHHLDHSSYSKIINSVFKIFVKK